MSIAEPKNSSVSSMTEGVRRYIIGLDFGSESARGVLIDAETAEQVGIHVHPYRHGIMVNAPTDGAPLPRGWALQDASDYSEAALEILTALGSGRVVESIGLGFTASSPLPAKDDGRPLSQLYRGEPHAYVKLWKHGAAQAFANAISARGGAFLDNFGGRVSGEWLLAKAAQFAAEAPHLWAETDKFIEAGDWLVWQLTGNEARSLGFAAYKAQYSRERGYPSEVVPGIATRLSDPHRIGSSAGRLTESWRRRTGILGPAIVAVAVIDSHAVLPAVGAVSKGCLVAALGTSAAYLYVTDQFRPLPPGIEGVAFEGAIHDLWCYEAGQASFGDTLAWFVNTSPKGEDIADSFRRYNLEADLLKPGASGLLALDWWNGNRVPSADSDLSGLIVGLRTRSTTAEIYRAILEALSFGARTISELFENGGLPVERVILTSGLADRNPLLVKIMANVFGRAVEIPEIANPTSVGAAIHGAVAAGLVQSYREGTEKFGARRFNRVEADPASAAVYRRLYQTYRKLSTDDNVRSAMHELARMASEATS